MKKIVKKNNRDDSSEGEESDNDLQALTEKLQQEEQFLDRARGEEVSELF